MKKIGAIVCLAALIVTMTVSVCFGAQTLKVVDRYPGNGQKNTTKENMCVKLTFNNDVGNKASAKANEDCFSITDAKGKKLPIKVFYNPKNAKKAMVLVDTTKINTNTVIKDNADYTLTISGDFIDNKGNELGEDEKVTFKTQNQGQSTKVYMGMMAVMMVGMFYFTSRQMKKQTAEQKNAQKEKDEPFNPYKEAKRTGKSIEEVTAAHEKEMKRKAAKAARKAGQKTDDDDDDDEEDDGKQRVKGPKPISAGGGTYITGRKAIAEAKKAEEERLAKRRAAAQKKKKK